MSWKSDKSIERVVKLYKRVPKQVFPEDIEAIKNINETILESEKVLVNDHILFAKLVCYVLNLNLHHSGSMKGAIASLNTELERPLDHHLTFLTSNLNQQELNNYLKDLGFNFESLESEPEKIKANEKGMIEKIKGNWTKEKVTKSFCNTVNEFIKNINNYI